MVNIRASNAWIATLARSTRGPLDGVPAVGTHRADGAVEGPAGLAGGSHGHRYRSANIIARQHTRGGLVPNDNCVAVQLTVGNARRVRVAPLGRSFMERHGVHFAGNDGVDERGNQRLVSTSFRRVSEEGLEERDFTRPQQVVAVQRSSAVTFFNRTVSLTCPKQASCLAFPPAKQEL